MRRRARLADVRFDPRFLDAGIDPGGRHRQRLRERIAELRARIGSAKGR